jgi:tRNA(fMet)-specific endonuclease VapC
MVTCSLAAHEVLYGASISARRSVQLAAAYALFDQMIVAEFSLEDAAAAADLRADLKRAGQPIGAFDTLIAGQALRRDWVVVAGNVREFGRIPGLQVVDWTAEAESP